MVKGPRTYSDIDLLYKGFQNYRKFTLTTNTTAGLEITSTSLKKGDLYSPDLATKLKSAKIGLALAIDLVGEVDTRAIGPEALKSVF